MSAVIVTWNSEDTIVDCVRSLRDDAGDDMEIIVVDNASADATVARARAADACVVCIVNDRNLGFASAVNLGLARARGELVLIVNPDVRVESGAVSALAEAIRESDSVGAAGPSIRRPCGALDFYAARRVPTAFDLVAEGLFLTRVLRRVPPFDRYLMGRWDHLDARDVECLSGACMMVPRHALDRVGGMDSTYFLFYEDIDWCERIRRAGLRLRYEPRARVVHRAHVSVFQDPYAAHRHAIDASRRFFTTGTRRTSRWLIDGIWLVVTVARTLLYAVLSIVPRRARKHASLALANARLIGYVLRTAGRSRRARQAA